MYIYNYSISNLSGTHSFVGDVALVVDISGSVYDGGGSVFLVDFFAAIVGTDSWTISFNSTRVAVLSCGQSTIVHMRMSDTTDAQSTMLTDVIYQGIPRSSGINNIPSLLQVLREDIFTSDSGDRPDVPNIVIVALDTTPPYWGTVEDELQQTKDAGITFFMIGIGDRINSPLVSKIATEPSNYFFVPNFMELTTISENLIYSLIHSSGELSPVLGMIPNSIAQTNT